MIFPIKETKGKRFKILTPKQILQRLPILPIQVRAGNTSKNLLSDILCIEQNKLHIEQYNKSNKSIIHKWIP